MQVISRVVVSLLLGFAVNGIGAEVAKPSTPPVEATPVHGPVPAPPKAKAHSQTRAKAAKRTANVSSPAKSHVSEMYGQTRFVFDEARNLLVANQKYFIKYEDEESFGRVAATANGSLAATFSPSDVADFQKAVETVGDYRNRMKSHCGGVSTRYFVDALDRYMSSLASFNRRALPLVADISENNNQLILVVNRTALVDAPVLMSRYLQFKKQRFKESMNRFLPSDSELIGSLVSIAKMLKVEVSDEDWNKTYGLRDNALELVSLWPREPIFEATEKLTDAKESACIVSLAKPTQASAKPAAPAAGKTCE